MADPRVTSLLRRIARRAGFDLLRADHYSPVPDLRTLPDAVWERRSPMPGPSSTSTPTSRCSKGRCGRTSTSSARRGRVARATRTTT